MIIRYRTTKRQQTTTEAENDIPCLRIYYLY